MAQPQALPAIVKSVLSGDSLLLMGRDASRGPPPEKLISLSGIAAPRMGSKTAADQPYAWASREFLRHQVLGKCVTFIPEPPAGAPPAGNRGFGSVCLEDGTSLAVLVAVNGWAKARPGGPEDIVQAANAAEAQGIGLWAPGPSGDAVRDVKYAGSFEPEDLFKRFGSSPQQAIIEQVSNGSVLRVLLLPDFYQITLMLSGIQCGAIRRNEDGTEEAAPFAREARYFVETRLLNRDVQVSLEGIDKNGNLLGTVIHPAGNVSVELVKVGLARVVDWSAQVCPHAPTLRQAERTAKEKRLRMWKDYVPPNHGGDMAEYVGRVVEIVSGDTLIVTDQAGAEKRLSLSSLRCPRMGREPEPYAVESKELLRKLLIGKKVKVTPEYKRTFAPEGQPPQERTFATVTYNNDKNAATALLVEGLATVNRQGQSEERSAHFETLLETEEAARSAKKGMHSSAPPPKSSVTDLTTPDSRERAKRFLSSLQRQGLQRATVQFILNGARFKLLVGKENCLVTFVCAGVRCPMCTRRDTGVGGEPFGDEALAFARNLCFQRDVDIEVESVDKNGVFMGSLFLGEKGDYSVMLLEAGLAKRQLPAADRSPHAADLARAEDKAKSTGLKVWETYSQEEEEAAREAAAAAARAEQDAVPDGQKQVVELELTEICDGAHFYAHVATDSTVATLQEQIAASCQGDSDGGYEPKVGHTCCARFTADNEWYRAKVVSRTATEYTVFFLDYGNSDVVPKSRLKALDASLGPQMVSPQAVECRLAHLIANPPDDGAEGEEAARALSDAAWGKRVFARVEDRDAGVLLVTLLDDATGSVNEDLVSQGLLKVAKKFDKRAAPLVKGLQEKCDAAKTRRLGMWKYGDVDDDDEALDFGMNRVKKQLAAAATAPSSNPWKK